jgi:uncharacterized protein
MIKVQLEQDIKVAMLAKEANKVTVLRGLKAAIMNAEVATGMREEGLANDAVMALLQKESKKRQDTAAIYEQGGAPEKAAAELAEKAIIDAYLPEQLDEAALQTLVDEVIAAVQPEGVRDMGKVIAGVRQKTGAAADGGLIAKFVKERLQ